MEKYITLSYPEMCEKIDAFDDSSAPECWCYAAAACRAQARPSTTVASSNPLSRQTMAFGAFSLKSARTSFNSFRAVTKSGASKSSFSLGFSSPCSALGQLSRILRLKWVWHLCQETPWKCLRIALTRPPWSSEVIISTPLKPLPFNQVKNSDQVASDSLSPIFMPRISR